MKRKIHIDGRRSVPRLMKRSPKHKGESIKSTDCTKSWLSSKQTHRTNESKIIVDDF
jgi:hypothetical protein